MPAFDTVYITCEYKKKKKKDNSVMSSRGSIDDLKVTFQTFSFLIDKLIFENLVHLIGVKTVRGYLKITNLQAI